MPPVPRNIFAAICLFAVMPLYSLAAASAMENAAASIRQSDAEAAHDAEAALRAADQAIGEQDWPAANRRLQQGIDLIQFRSRSLQAQAGVIDDSEFDLYRAWRKEQDGDLQSAAQLRRWYLTHLLETLREKSAK
jgi:hypothetical protein